MGVRGMDESSYCQREHGLVESCLDGVFLESLLPRLRLLSASPSQPACTTSNHAFGQHLPLDFISKGFHICRYPIAKLRVREERNMLEIIVTRGRRGKELHKGTNVNAQYL